MKAVSSCGRLPSGRELWSVARAPYALAPGAPVLATWLGYRSRLGVTSGVRGPRRRKSKDNLVDGVAEDLTATQVVPYVYRHVRGPVGQAREGSGGRSQSDARGPALLARSALTRSLPQPWLDSGSCLVYDPSREGFKAGNVALTRSASARE